MDNITMSDMPTEWGKVRCGKCGSEFFGLNHDCLDVLNKAEIEKLTKRVDELEKSMKLLLSDRSDMMAAYEKFKKGKDNDINVKPAKD